MGKITGRAWPARLAEMIIILWIMIIIIITIIIIISASFAGQPRPVFFPKKNDLKTETEPHYALYSES